MMRSKGLLYQVGLIGLALAISPGDPARAAERRPKEVRQVLEKDGQKRDFVPFSESEIQKSLIGRRFVVDQVVDWQPNKMSVAFGEEFSPDGSWTLSRPMRGVVVEHGLWRVHDRKICTRLIQSPFGLKEGQREVCRQVWRDKSSGNIAMTDVDKNSRDVLIFSSTPLK